MDRKAFLCTIAAIIAAPFKVKPEKPIAMPPAHRLGSFERATFENLQEKQEEFLAQLRKSFQVTIKGSDLKAVVERQNYRRAGTALTNLGEQVKKAL